MISYIYQLLPEREGSFVIGAATVEVSGETYRTEPIQIEVVSGSVAPRGPSRRGLGSSGPPGMGRRREPEISADDVFMRAEVSSRSVYVGEEVLLTYRVHSKFVPHGPQVDDDPPLTGFWVEDVALGNPTIERTVIDGQEYLSFPIKQRRTLPDEAR